MHGVTTKATRSVVAAGLGAALLVAAPGVRAADERMQCASAADQAQQLRDEGKYRGAREQLLVCARDVCPGPIRKDCGEWLAQLETLAPTVVLAAKEGPNDVTDVKVTMDGAPLGDHLDGRPIPVDLGQHTFAFDYHGAVKEAHVLIGAGQKGRNISVTFPGKEPPPPPPPSQGSITPALVIGGLGVVALGSFAFFGLSGRSDYDDLVQRNCKPNCEQSAVDKVRTKLIVADISLGVGVVALGVATYMILARPKVETSVKTGVSSVRFDVTPTRGGAAAALGGRF